MWDIYKENETQAILPRFRRDVTKFRSFWDSFKSAVDENDELSVVDKFNYLQSSWTTIVGS